MTDGSSIEINTKEVLLGITIDKDLKFDDHVNSLCKKAFQKLNALARLAPFMNVEKRRIIMKAFIESVTIHRVCYIHNSVTIHHKNRTLGIETFKVQHGLSPPLLVEVFVERNWNYNLRGNSFLNRRKVNSVRYSTESVSFLAPKLWDILPKEIKNSETLNTFKAKIKNWVPNICIASRIYLRNNNTITIKLYISLGRLTSISFYFRKCYYNIKVICYVNVNIYSNKMLLVWSTLKNKKRRKKQSVRPIYK